MQNLIPIIAIIISVISLSLTIFIFTKIKKLITLKNKEDLSKLLIKNFSEMEDVKEAHNALLDEIKKLGSMSYKSLQKIGFSRYNPFKDVGGNQSFSICLLDTKNNGFILSNLYYRDKSSIYAKEIHKGTPLQKLSEEEEQTLKKAIDRK